MQTALACRCRAAAATATAAATTAAAATAAATVARSASAGAAALHRHSAAAPAAAAVAKTAAAAAAEGVSCFSLDKPSEVQYSSCMQRNRGPLLQGGPRGPRGPLPHTVLLAVSDSSKYYRRPLSCSLQHALSRAAAAAAGDPAAAASAAAIAAKAHSRTADWRSSSLLLQRLLQQQQQQQQQGLLSVGLTGVSNNQWRFLSTAAASTDPAAAARAAAAAAAAAGQTPGTSSTPPSDKTGPPHSPKQQQQQQQQHHHQQQQQQQQQKPDRRSSRVYIICRSFNLVFRVLLKISHKLIKLLARFVRSVCVYTAEFIRNPRVAEKWYQHLKEATLHTIRWCMTGFRLFFANVRVSHQLLKKKILGYPLRYNEHKLLVRTTADALKLIPFSILIIVPLGELLIPVALRLFPNMLPSTFQQKNVDHAFLSRKLQAKQELAAFFQELLQEHTRQLIEQTPAADSAAKALALKSFQSKLVTPNNDKKLPLPGLKEVLEFSRMFKDDFVLEKMDLQTLQVMCKLLGLQPYSVRSHVVLQLRHHINHIQREDRELLWEGVESLTHEELVEACRDRGMKFYKTTDDEMREQMRQWLEVSSHRDVPPILLLWSRCVSMVPAAQLQPTAAAAAATAGAAEAAAEPSISLAAVAGQQAAADDKKKEEAAAGAAAAAAAADADTEAETLRKTASLEAMTKQVELLKEEEESLRQTITLLQEERAQHAQMQKMQRHPEAAEDESAESEPTLASVSQEKQQEQQQQQQKQQLHREQQQQVGEADATETKERRDCRDVERELRLLRQLTDIQHEHEERQFHVFNQVQMAVEALKSKLAPPPPKPAPAAAAAAGKGEAADKAAAGEPATGEATKVPAGEGAAAAAEGAAPDTPAAGEVLEEDPNEIIRQRAAELLHDELRELELCMQLLAREFAEDAKEVEHFMTDARTPPEELEAPNDQVKEEAAANTDPPAKTDGGAAAASPTASKKE